MRDGDSPAADRALLWRKALPLLLSRTARRGGAAGRADVCSRFGRFFGGKYADLVRLLKDDIAATRALAASSTSREPGSSLAHCLKLIVEGQLSKARISSCHTPRGCHRPHNSSAARGETSEAQRTVPSQSSSRGYRTLRGCRTDTQNRTLETTRARHPWTRRLAE